MAGCTMWSVKWAEETEIVAYAREGMQGGKHQKPGPRVQADTPISYSRRVK